MHDARMNQRMHARIQEEVGIRDGLARTENDVLYTHANAQLHTHLGEFVFKHRLLVGEDLDLLLEQVDCRHHVL
jgi:hypothetical protein